MTAEKAALAADRAALEKEREKLAKERAEEAERARTAGAALAAAQTSIESEREAQQRELRKKVESVQARSKPSLRAERAQSRYPHRCCRPTMLLNGPFTLSCPTRPARRVSLLHNTSGRCGEGGGGAASCGARARGARGRAEGA